MQLLRWIGVRSRWPNNDQLAVRLRHLALLLNTINVHKHENELTLFVRTVDILKRGAFAQQLSLCVLAMRRARAWGSLGDRAPVVVECKGRRARRC